MLHATLIFTLISGVLGQDCPDQTFVGCATEGGSCGIPDTISEGYLSYGANGQYMLVPFSNTNGPLNIQCDNDHGDIIFGTVKKCCYKAADIGFDLNSFGNQIAENDPAVDIGADIFSMRYGANGEYVYRVIFGADGHCNNNFFNDPIYGTVKHCETSASNPAHLDSAIWTECADEGATCAGDGNELQWVRYGAFSGDDEFYYKLVMASKVPCTNGFFGDSKPGTVKKCWRAPTSLKCPDGSHQVGAINADIGGCGLQSCDARYDLSTIEECRDRCDRNINCKAFNWAPLNGDRNHMDKRACTMYGENNPTSAWGPNQIFCDILECPIGSTQVGGLDADIPGCGLQSCDQRYDVNTIEACQLRCDRNDDCRAFTWAPTKGDRNHMDKKVCTMYNADAPTSSWSPNQIFCDILECPAGSSQIGDINADIGGCGLQGCGERYGVVNIEECRDRCDMRDDCRAFNWAPLNGDKNHKSSKVCTLYDRDTPTGKWGDNQIFCDILECPVGSTQVGRLNADVSGCGLQSCGLRYDVNTIEQCRDRCDKNDGCRAFTWAPLNGDKNHKSSKVCTLYDRDTPTTTWGDNQIFCDILECPSGTTQVGALNADIGGCGLQGCDRRYDLDTIEECRDRCRARMDCKSITWAPLKGDRNHKAQKVCTLYGENKPSGKWGPNQIFCDLPEPETKPFYRYWRAATGDHFYTTNAAEIGTTTPGQTGNHGYISEGAVGKLIANSENVPGAVPLYRYWKAPVVDHFYTTNAEEIGTTTAGQVGNYGYQSEGVAGKCFRTPGPQLVALYRYWNPYINDHFYTTNYAELGTGKYGWVTEGIACYVVGPASAISPVGDWNDFDNEVNGKPNPMQHNPIQHVVNSLWSTNGMMMAGFVGVILLLILNIVYMKWCKKKKTGYKTVSMDTEYDTETPLQA